MCTDRTFILPVSAGSFTILPDTHTDSTTMIDEVGTRGVATVSPPCYLDRRVYWARSLPLPVLTSSSIGSISCSAARYPLRPRHGWPTMPTSAQTAWQFAASPLL